MSELLLYATLGGLAALVCSRSVLEVRPGRTAVAARVLPPTPRDQVRAAVGLAVLGAVAAVAAGPFGGSTVPLAAAWVATTMTVIAVVDHRTHRLPNVMVLPALAVSVVVLVLEERRDPAAGSLTLALSALPAVGIPATAVGLLLPGRVGMGDMRFLLLPVPVLAYQGLGPLVAYGLVLCASAVVAFSLLLKHGRRDDVLAAGPVIALGAVLTLAGQAPARALLDLWERMWW